MLVLRPTRTHTHIHMQAHYVSTTPVSGLRQSVCPAAGPWIPSSPSCIMNTNTHPHTHTRLSPLACPDVAVVFPRSVSETLWSPHYAAWTYGHSSTWPDTLIHKTGTLSIFSSYHHQRQTGPCVSQCPLQWLFLRPPYMHMQREQRATFSGM